MYPLSRGAEKDATSTTWNSIYPMVSVPSAVSTVLKCANNWRDNVIDCTQKATSADDEKDITSIPIALSPLDSILAEDVYSPSHVPPFPTSMMDGFAIASLEVSVAEVDSLDQSTFNLVCVGNAFAGDSSPNQITLEAGQVLYVTTGSFVPRNTCAVIPVEECYGDNILASKSTKIQISLTTVKKYLGPVSFEPASTSTIVSRKNSPPMFVRPVGSDIVLDSMLLKKGSKITAANVGLCLSAKVTHVKIFSPKSGTSDQLQLKGCQTSSQDFSQELMKLKLDDKIFEAPKFSSALPSSSSSTSSPSISSTSNSQHTQRIAPVRVLVVSTGDELLDAMEYSLASSTIATNQIFDSNTPMLLRMLWEHAESLSKDYSQLLGLSIPSSDLVHLYRTKIVEDTYESTEFLLTKAAQVFDIIVSTGGVSMGEKDFVKKVMEARFCMQFGRLHMKPGKPASMACGFQSHTSKASEGLRSAMVFGLPGNPVSAFVCSHLLVLPAITTMTAPFPVSTVSTSPTHDENKITDISQLQGEITALLASPVLTDPERPEFHRVSLSKRTDTDGGSGKTEVYALTTGKQASCRLLSIIDFNAFALISVDHPIIQERAAKKGVSVDDLSPIELTLPAGSPIVCYPLSFLPRSRNGSHAPTQAQPSTAAQKYVADLPLLPTGSELQPKSNQNDQDHDSGCPCGKKEQTTKMSANPNHSTSNETACLPMANSKQKYNLRISLMVVSDRAFDGTYEDRCIPAAKKCIFSTTFNKFAPVIHNCIICSDDVDEISKRIIKLCDNEETASDIVITMGGTGFGPRDNTPQVTSSLLHRHANGIVHCMTELSLKATPLGALSCGVAGTRFKTLILNFPGNPKAFAEIFPGVSKIIEHACQHLNPSLLSDDNIASQDDISNW